MHAKKEKICPPYVSRHNLNQEKQVVISVISNGDKQRWQCLAVKELSALLKGITSKHHGDFYCLNRFHSFATKNNLQSDKRLCEKKKIIMSTKISKILELHQYQNPKKHHLLFMQILSLQ